jgi:Mn-containing catalase
LGIEGLLESGREMFLRKDKLQIELPRPAQADPESAGVVQELMGGKFGEMSTLVYVPEHKNA